MKQTNAQMKDVFDSEDFERAYHTNEPLGAYCGAEETRFALWAPTAQSVTLNLYADGSEGAPYAQKAMRRGDKGVWHEQEQGDLHGTYYDYDVTVDGVTRRTGDPYARACGLNGVRSMAVDLARTNPDGWERDRAPERPAENVIYELHVKDFSFDEASGVPEEHRGKYKALTLRGTTLHGDGVHPTCLDYVKRLGVTHVQLMPVYDYGSVNEAGAAEEYNWGYDPTNYNVPEGSYASDPRRGEVRIRELKEAIAALHESGLRVIMDVVYNHTYSLDSCLFKSVPWYYYRQNADGSPSNGSGCGNDIATERSMTARYILESVLYWAQEYHMDGFRFDLMGLMDAELMTRIRHALDERFGEGEKLVYGEPWSAGGTAAREGTLLADKGSLGKLPLGVGAFCDNTRDAVKGGLSQRALGFVSGGDFSAAYLACCVKGWANVGGGFSLRAPMQTITYLSCHDDWTLWDKLIYTMDGGKRFRRGTADVLRANRLAAAISLCCQGHVFFLAGEEFARTKLGVKNSYRTTPLINRLDWKRAWQFEPLVNYYRGLIALRKQLPALTDKSAQAADRVKAVRQFEEGVAGIRLDNTGGESVYESIVLGVNVTREAVAFTLPHGEWEVLCDGADSFLWESPSSETGTVTLAPGSMMVFGRR